MAEQSRGGEAPRRTAGRSRIPQISGRPLQNAAPRLLRDIGITLGGVIALLAPLALWVAWSPAVFSVILLIGCAAIGIVFLLVWLSKDEYI